MVNIEGVRKRILDNILFLTALHTTVETFAKDPTNENAQDMVAAFHQVSDASTLVVAAVKESMANMVKLAGGETDALEVAVSEDEQGFRIE